MAISMRKTLSRAVTDVLVLRGNNEVLQSAVNNPGRIHRARFHPPGQSRGRRRQSRDLHRIASGHTTASLPETGDEGIGDRTAAAGGRQPAASEGSPERGARGDATPRPPRPPPSRTRRFPHALVKSFPRGRSARRIPGGLICRGRQVDETNASIAALANVHADIGCREHDD